MTEQSDPAPATLSAWILSFLNKHPHRRVQPRTVRKLPRIAQIVASTGREADPKP